MWFIVGGLVGWGAAHGGPAVQRAWPVCLRVQILATSATLSLVAAWRLTSVGQLLGPLALSAGMWLLLGATLLSRGERSAGQSSLEAWAVTPNASFWVVPTAAAFAGSAGTMIAVLANVITTAWNAVAVHLMRRDAPFRQRRSTTWVDQSPVLASLVGLLLHLLGPAPTWTADVLTLAGPLLAFSGAALFTGSVIHPHNLAVPRTGHAVRRWGWLTALRDRVLRAHRHRGGARRVDRARRRGRPHGPERAVLPAHSALGSLRLPLRGGSGRGALGLDPGPPGSRCGGARSLIGVVGSATATISAGAESGRVGRW